MPSVSKVISAFVGKALALWLGAALACQSETASSPALPEVVEVHCAGCHTGPDAERGFDVDRVFGFGIEPGEREARLQLAVARVRSRTMPPPDDSELEDPAERRELIAAFARAAPVRPGTRIAAMRRLTASQYERTVQRLFGIEWRVEGLLPSDATVRGFEGIGDVQNVSPLLFEKYFDAATVVADAVLADDAATARVFGGDRPLADVLPRLLQRAFRRPVSETEIADYAVDTLVLLRRGGLQRDARHALLRSLLTTPSFLFRAEVGMPDDASRLAPHELAVRLSYMLTSGPPDDALWACVVDESLLDANVLVREARRLLQQDEARALADEFAAAWLSLRDVLTTTADFRRFPAIWNRSLRPSLYREAVETFRYVAHADRSVLELLDAEYVFVNRTLAKHYGLPPVKGKALQRVARADRRRGGLVTSGAMLMATSQPLRTSPVKRGQWILSKLLDAPPPPPPPDAGTLPRDDKQGDGLTLRQRLERHRREARCAACHAEMDALGFALESFDPLGRWRDEVHGKDVDTRAELPGGQRIDGPVELKDALLQRADEFVRSFAKHLLVHAIGRDLGLRDEPMLAAVVARTREGGDRMSALLAAVVTSPLFTMRDPEALR